MVSRRVALRYALISTVSLAAAGCTTPPPAIPPEPAASSIRTQPGGSLSLAQLGFTHGPDDFWLPAGTTIRDRVDLATNITITVTSPDGATLAQWLRENLPAAGFEITADGQDSLLFARNHWQGAFTVTGELSALSLRSDRE